MTRRNKPAPDFRDLARINAEIAERRRGWAVKDDNQADATAIWDFACAVLGRRT